MEEVEPPHEVIPVAEDSHEIPPTAVELAVKIVPSDPIVKALHAEELPTIRLPVLEASEARFPSEEVELFTNPKRNALFEFSLVLNVPMVSEEPVTNIAACTTIPDNKNDITTESRIVWKRLFMLNFLFDWCVPRLLTLKK